MSEELLLPLLFHRDFPVYGLFLFCAEKMTFLKIRKKNLILVPRFILPCLALGVSTFVMQASESVISVCFNSSLQKVWGQTLQWGSMTILTSVMQFAMLPLQGLGPGSSTYYQL